MALSESPARDADDAALLTSTPIAERYAVERELGRGGMATVYLAEERKHARQVAIKVLRPELAASLGGERFLREIAIVARLAHPHVVPLIDSGEVEGRLYYVSPFVPGGSLRERLIGEQRLPVADVVRFATEVGTALDYAHRAGFVHRDVKPENILFADGHALLADFGVARTCASDVTAAGIAVGTPEYMSPEQASGDEVGSASDVYSLACVVYEALAGEPPFHGPSARATMARHVTATPPSVRALRPEVPTALDAALCRAMAKAPEQRFASVADFATALQSAVTASSLPVHRATIATRSIAVLPFVNASPDPENEYLSDGITDELIDGLAKLSGLRVASRTSVFALKGKSLDIRAIGALLGASAVIEGSVRRAGARLRVTAQLTSADDGRLLWSQRYDRDLDDVLAVQDEIAHTIVTTLRTTWLSDLEEPRSRRHTASALAYNLYLRGRFALGKRTQEGVAEGIEHFERAIGEDPRFALAYTGLSDAYSLHVDYRSVPVAEGFARAKAYAKRALEIDDTLAEAHASLAWCLFIYDWEWAAAEREFHRSIELDPRYPPARQWYAFLLAAQRRMEDALVEGHTALDLDPGAVWGRRGVAWLYFYARRYAQAREHLYRAIEMNPTAEETFRTLGLTLAVSGDPVEAVRVLREAMAMPSAGSYTMATLAYALARAGERREAQSLRDSLHATHATSYVSPAALATVHLGLGENDEAITWIERARAERRGWVAYVHVNPIFDPVRGDPRFVALVEGMGIRT